MGGLQLLRKGFLPCFWRAPTDNDNGGGETSYASQWKSASLDNIIFHTESCSIQSLTDQKVNINTVYYALKNNDTEKSVSLSSSPDDKSLVDAAIFKIEVIYHVYASGDVIVDYVIKPRSDLPPLPRIGLTFQIDKSLDQVKWYGKGPFECYPDRKEAAFVGVYENKVKELHVPYIFPGECSGRADVRWVAFLDEKGVGLFTSAYGDSPPMQMNASFYGSEELHRATHNEDLIKGENIEVCIPHSLFIKFDIASLFLRWSCYLSFPFCHFDVLL